MGPEGRLEDRILGMEAGKPNAMTQDERHADAGQRQGTDPHQDEGLRRLLLHAAHLAHVLLVVQGVDHRARTEKQQRLEEGVRHQM